MGRQTPKVAVHYLLGLTKRTKSSRSSNKFINLAHALAKHSMTLFTGNHSLHPIRLWLKDLKVDIVAELDALHILSPTVNRRS